MAGLADTKGHLTKTYQYIVTGERAYGSATYENEYTYNGESYNPNIHSQYLRARYYSVVTASFLTEDSYLGDIREPLTLNRYNYCISNYMNYEDPSGNIIGSLLVTCAVVGGVIGLVVGVGSEVYRALETDNYNWTEGVCNVITDAASGVVGGITCAVTGGNPVAVGLTTGMVHGFLDGIVHIDSTKGVEENASNIVTGSAREGFIGLMYGAGFEFAAMCVGNTSLPVLAKLFIMGANGGATAGTTSRYLSGDEVTAETIAGDAVIGGISTLVLNELARAIQWKMTAGPELPEGYIRDRANSVAKLNASGRCEDNLSKQIKGLSYDASLLKQTQPYTNEYEVNRLVEHIAQNGPNSVDPIQVRVHEGTAYIVDGHHRYNAFLKLGYDRVPIKYLHNSNLGKVLQDGSYVRPLEDILAGAELCQ